MRGIDLWPHRFTKVSISVPLNETALLVIGGYSGKKAVKNVDVLDTATGRLEGKCILYVSHV